MSSKLAVFLIGFLIIQLGLRYKQFSLASEIPQLYEIFRIEIIIAVIRILVSIIGTNYMKNLVNK